MCIRNYIKDHKDIQTQARGRVISVISREFLTLGNSHNVIKCFGPRYAPDIQRWNSNLMDQVFPSIFGRDCIPFIFGFCYKGFQTSFLSLFITVCNFRALISLHSLLIRLFVIPSQKRLQRSSREKKISLHLILRKFRSPNFLYLLG